MDTALFSLLALFLLLLALFHFASRDSRKNKRLAHPLHDAKEAEELAESAKEKYDRKAYKDALRDADSAFELEPKNRYLLWLRASIHNALENRQLAIEDCERLLAQDDLYHWAYEQRGLAYLALRQLDKAKADFEQAILLSKEAIQAYGGLFALALEAKDEPQAERVLKKILELTPSENDGLKLIVQMLYNMKAYGLLLKFIDEMLKQEKLAEDALLFYRAWSFYYLKDYLKALADARRMFEINPDDNAPIRLQGFSYQALKDYDSAALSFEQYLEKKPDSLSIVYAFAYCLWNMGRYAEALPLVKNLQEQETDKPKYINMEGLIYLGQNDFAKAVDAFSIAISLSPDESVYYDNRSLAYRHLKQFENAWEDNQKALSRDPDSTYVYCNRAALFLSEGKTDAAFENIKKALELDVNEMYIYHIRAKIFVALENYEAAINDIQKAREIADYKPWRFNILEAVIEAARGNHEQAQQLWNVAASEEAKLSNLDWVSVEYELPEKLIPLAQALIQQKKP